MDAPLETLISTLQTYVDMSLKNSEESEDILMKRAMADPEHPDKGTFINDVTSFGQKKGECKNLDYVGKFQKPLKRWFRTNVGNPIKNYINFLLARFSKIHTLFQCFQ